MKVIKKIAAIMFALVMVISMGANVSVAHAEEGAQPGTKGKITINSAVDKQTYTIYKMLDLDYDPVNELYSYKPASNEWKAFFEEGQPGHDYATINENGYITWTDKSVANETQEEKKVRLEKEAAGLAQKALAYAKDTNKGITKTKDAQAVGTTVVFSDLELGYYLVDSSVGALCGLTTTNHEVEIKEKNGVPSVDKQVASNGSGYSNVSYANIGDEVSFQITIDVKKGAYNYKLYDKMSKGFKLKDPMNTITNSTLQVHAADSEGTFYDTLKEDQDYTLTKNSDGFTVEFKNEYLKTHETVEYKIVVSYIAILTGDAEIGNSGVGNTNETYLTYGDKNTESNHSTTNTYTFGIPVFKYTGSNVGLAGAKFSLYSDESCTNIITLIKPETGETYRRFIDGTDDNSKKVTVIETTATGEFNITGLNLGTYYLKEIEAPKGYNKLNNAIVVTIDKSTDGTNTVKLFQDGKETTKVEVLNKSGSLLPSTGGMGTTIFYIAGAFLVLISGVVLIAKKRTDSK